MMDIDMGQKTRVQVSAVLTKYDPIYKLTVVVESDKKKQKLATLKRPISDWFDAEGALHADTFVDCITRLVSQHAKSVSD
jgi:hypothetical protein